MSNEKGLQASRDPVPETIAAAPESAARGRLFVVSAPSGAGKSSLVELALERVDRLRFSISSTTRPPRGQEKDGVDYCFISMDEFAAMRENGEFLEWAEVHGHFYGTPVGQIERVLDAGDDLILDI